MFLAPPWKEIYTTDSERKPDFAEAERTYDGMAEIYQELGYHTVELPTLAPEARALFMVGQIHSGDRLGNS